MAPPRVYKNAEAKDLSDRLVRDMVRYCVSPTALQRKTQLPAETVKKAITAADMSSAIYEGLLQALEEIRNADAR